MADEKRVSALEPRIAAGLADPITDWEREIAARIVADYERRFGREAASPRGRRP